MAGGDDATQKDVLKLVYITALVTVAVLALFLLHVLGSLRRRSSDKLLHAIVLGAYTLSYSLVSYTIGLMQKSEYYLYEFPVWAVCLLMLLGGTDNLMACKLNDVDNWKSYHVKHLLQGALVTFIVAYYGQYLPQHVPEYRKPLWAMLFVNVLQSCVRIKSMRTASKHNLLSENVKPIVDHMKVDNQEQRFDPVTMEGYKYVVSGEHREKNNDKQTVKGSAEKKVDRMKITTVEQIWQCKGSLLRHERGMRLKDICLSMALSKMLNRRFAGFELAEAELDKTHDFVFKGLLAGDKSSERTFRVIEVELGFVYDLYYTRYPYLYHKVRHFALCLPVAMVIFCSWLTYVLFKREKELGRDLSLSTTLFLMVVVTFLEAFQLYLHLSSNWFKVALVRSYVTRPTLQRSCCCFSAMIISLTLRLMALRPWERKLGQYNFLQNYDGTRRTSTCIHYMTLWLVDKAKKGRKRGKLVKLSRQVKQSIIDSFIISEGRLTNGAESLRKNGVYEELSWACKLGTVDETILVWHVATTICKHNSDAAMAKAGKQTAALSDKDGSSGVVTASNLSQYCAYLVAFAPDLLPGHSFDSATILDKSIEDARKLPDLRGAKKMEDKCKKLMSIIHTNSNDAPLVVQGARLAGQLEDLKDIAPQWKVLSEFWAEMMLYIAPCDDAQARAHLEALARGGEFITHLWALLTHAGVLERDRARSISAV